jgi:rhamnosyltransferase
MLRKIAIGFVIYDANFYQLNRVHDASRSGFPVYVYDNSPEKINSQEFAKNRGNVAYLTCGKNVGLGLGMASVCAQAYYDGHSALLFFDQDTIFKSDTLSFIEEFYINHSDLSTKYSAITFNEKKFKSLTNINNEHLHNVLLVINSGSLFFLENLKKLNWHNKKYFVDCVDYEFCLNSKISGFEIGEFSFTPGLDHSSEQDDTGYRIFGRIYSMRAYSITRIYDTCSASLKLMLKSIATGQIKFFLVIFRLLVIYVATQLFVRIFGWIFTKRMQGG